MGWTSYSAPTKYKSGKVIIDRKEECDKIFNQDMVTWDDSKNVIGKFEVLKSAMVGSTYYAAVKRTKFKTETEPENSIVFAAICLTSTNMKEYYNFSYKDMDETCGPYQCDCPKGILDLLTPTDSEYANKWREACRINLEKKRNPNALNRLPVGSVIKFKAPCDLKRYKKGDEITLTKTKRWSGKSSYWIDGYYYYNTKLIGNDYVVVKKGE